MDTEGFRIKLNLTEFFTDQRKYSYIFIELNQINDFYDLERRIRRIFSITENIIFLIDNVLVPHSENIKLIHEEETLTLTAGTIGLNTYLRTRSNKSTQTKDLTKRSKKLVVCQEGCKACFHYFQSENCCVSSPQKKRKKLQSLNDCNASQNKLYLNNGTDSVTPNIETVEVHGTENEMFLRVNKIYEFGSNTNVDINESPPSNKKKVRFKIVTKNEEKPIMPEEETIDSKTESNSIKDRSQIMSNDMGNFYFQEPYYTMQAQGRGRKKSSSSDMKETVIKSHNKVNDMDTIDIGRVDHSPKMQSEHSVSSQSVSEIMRFNEPKLSKEEFLSIDKLKFDTSLMQNDDNGKIVYLSENREKINNTETRVSLPINNNRVNDESSSIDTVNVENSSLIRKRTRTKTRRKKQIVQETVSESPNINTETSHIRFADGGLRECSPLPTKCEAFLARIKTPNPVDIFRKILSSSVVLNQTSSNSKKIEEVTSGDEEPIVIDCDIEEEDDACLHLEKYPLINSSPRKGDIIAFKLKRVATDGTSIVTQYIVAEVLKYCDVTSQITVKVQCGLDQLEEPQRIFSLFDDPEESSNKNNTYEYNWNELLETRLIYP